MEEYLEDTRPTLDELCKENGDGDCKDCPAYEFCHNERREQMKRMYIISAIIVAFALFLAVGIGIGIRISQPKEEKDVEYCTECPMCGERVKLNPVDDVWYIECQNLDCGLKTGYFDNKEKLIEKWNKMFKTLSERKENK